MENIEALNKLEVFIANINTKSCREKIDDFVSTNDIYIVLDRGH